MGGVTWLPMCPPSKGPGRSGRLAPVFALAGFNFRCFIHKNGFCRGSGPAELLVLATAHSGGEESWVLEEGEEAADEPGAILWAHPGKLWAYIATDQLLL